MVMPRAFSSGAASIWSYAFASPPYNLLSTDVSAAVRVVLPWSTWPIVPTLTCGLVRANFSFAISTPKSYKNQSPLTSKTSHGTQRAAPAQNMVPIAGIGPATSPLPRECSTTEPNGQNLKSSQNSFTATQRKSQAAGPHNRAAYGAGDGNRTRVISLEG